MCALCCETSVVVSHAISRDPIRLSLHFFLARENVCSVVRRGFSRENAQPSVIAQGAMKGRNVSH